MPVGFAITKYLAARFRALGRRRHRDEPQAVLAAASATIRRKRFCLFISQGGTDLSARVLQPWPPGPALDVWFGTSASSRKVTELRDDSRATIAYQDDGMAACVVLAGRVSVIDAADERVRRFMPSWYAFWPDGPASPDFVLLHFVPHRIEVWDGRRGITPEPFGLRSACLVRRDAEWVAA